jgi:hypothetical protein
MRLGSLVTPSGGCTDSEGEALDLHREILNLQHTIENSYFQK